MICPKCGAPAVKSGFRVSRRGRKQRWLCQLGHIFTRKSAREEYMER